MSYFGISGIGNPYASISSAYARSRIRTSPVRRQNTAPYASKLRYNSRIGNSSDRYSYRASGITDSLTRLQAIKNNAVKLSDSASRLLATGKNDLFAKKEITAEDGTKQDRYDTDAIYHAVKDFVGSYNDALSSLENDSTQSVQNASKTLSRITASVEKSLGEIGISVGKDQKLSIDEKAFREADMEKVKTLMNGTFPQMAASAASRIYTAANTAYASRMASATRSMGSYNLFGGYNSLGSYLGGFDTLSRYGLGSFFNQYF